MSGQQFSEDDVFYILVEELVDKQGAITGTKVVGLISDGRYADLWDDGKHRRSFSAHLEEIDLDGVKGTPNGSR